MNKFTRRKMFSIPGVITLTILPYIFIYGYYAQLEMECRLVRVIPLVIADTSYDNKHSQILKKYNGHFPLQRNYMDININGDEEDKIKLDFAKLRIKQILIDNDTINGVHFRFGDSSQYGTFVTTIDILRTENAETYMPLNNDLWFYHFAPDTSATTFYR